MIIVHSLEVTIILFIFVFVQLCVAIAAAAALGRNNKHKVKVMADIVALLALAKENNERAKKVRAEVIAMRDALNTRITNLENQIANLTITEEQKAALEAELTGAREELSGIDALNDDAPSA